MIFGQLHISENVVHTHNDSYILSNITAVSARRPFLSSGILAAGLICVFGVAFADLLYPGEIVFIVASAAASLLIGFWLGQLQLLSRDLRGTELAAAIWGSYRHLNRIRRQVANAVNNVGSGGQS